MSVQFDRIVDGMPQLLKRLLASELLTRDNLRGTPQRGIYVFYENGVAIYVGRSNRLKDRLLEHGRRSSMHNSATFAFNLAKEKAKELDVKELDVNADDFQRNQLEKDSIFSGIFTEAKARVRRMKVRVITIDDQIEQTLFEVYAALALETPYNDFGTH